MIPLWVSRSCFGLAVLLLPLGTSVSAPADPFDGLLKRLRSRQEEVRAAALRDLKHFDRPEVPGLLVTLARDPSPRIRWNAVITMGYLAAQHPALLTAVIPALKDPKPKVRVAGLASLVQFNDPRTSEWLAQGLVDPLPYVVAPAMRFLSAEPPERALPAVTPLVTHTLASVRTAVMHILGAQKQPATLSLVVEGTRDPHDEVRTAAAEALGGFGPDAVPALQRLIQDDVEPVIRRRALETMQRIQDPAVRAALIHGTRHADDAVALQSLQGLTAFSHPETLDALIRSLADERLDRRVSALHTLQTFGTGGAPAVRAVMHVLTDASAEVRRTAAVTLGHFQHPVAIPALFPLLHDPDASVQEAARSALTMLGETDTPLLQRRVHP